MNRDSEDRGHRLDAEETRGRLISVVMPCFNAEAQIEESLRSALGQVGVDLELIVVDDGSTDGSCAVLERVAGGDARLRLVRQANRGAGPARNRGLAEARGAYVAFLDSDDYWAPDCLAKLRAALEASGAQLAYCGWQNVGLQGGRGEPYVPPEYADTDLVEATLRACPWPIHGALTRREVVDSVGGFDERWTSCMDYDLWLRLSPRLSVVRVPEVLAFYRHYEGERITKNRARIARNHYLVQREFLRKNPDVMRRLGRARVRKFVEGELLKRGFISYWARDLVAARVIFRMVMRTGYGRFRDWRYMLPCLLPLGVHQALLRSADTIRK